MIKIRLDMNSHNWRKGDKKLTIGNWFEGKFRALDKRTKYYKDTLPITAAQDFRQYLVDSFYTQKYFFRGYTKYSEKYAKWKRKRRAGFPDWWRMSNTVLIGLMYAKVEKIGNSDTYAAFTLDLGTHHTENGDTVKIEDVIKWNEEGTGLIPARPFFGPAFGDFKRSFYNRTATYMRDLVKAWNTGWGSVVGIHRH